MTKTFLTNLTIGLVAFALFTGITSVVSAQEETTQTDSLTPAERRENMQAALQDRQAEVEARRLEQQAALDERRAEMASRTDAMREQAEDRRETMEERREAVQEQIAERRAALSERVRDRILALADNVSQKMLAAIGRMEQIIDRFESRMEKLAENGVATESAATKLDEAQASLDSARVILETEVNDLVDQTVASDNPRQYWVQAKEKFGTTRTLLRTAHGQIREALALLKEAVVSAELGRGVSDAVRNEASDSTAESDENETVEETEKEE